jgi:hypothetical protein
VEFSDTGWKSNSTGPAKKEPSGIELEEMSNGGSEFPLFEGVVCMHLHRR